MRIFILFLVVVAFCAQGFAKTHPFNESFINQVSDLIYEGGQVSPTKLNAYIAEVQQKHLEVVGLVDGELAENSILINKYRADGKSDKKIIEKISEHEVHIVLMQALDLLSGIDSSTEFSEVLRRIKFSMDVTDALKIRGAPNTLFMAGQITEAITQSWKVKKRTEATDEASNLFDPEKNRYLSFEEIQSHLDQGKDLSVYDPARGSSFWQHQQNITAVNVRDAALGKNLDLYKDVKVYFPEDATYTLDGVKHSDTKPKLEVYARDERGKKQKFKLKAGAEIHSDPTAAALMATLGFPVDLTKHQKNIKVYLGDFNVSDLKREWEEYYSRDGVLFEFRIEDYIDEKMIASDENGQYVVFKEALIEAKPKGIERLGRWHFGYNSHESFREARGLMLVQMWLDNSDISNFRNNKLLMKETDSGYRPYHIISDPGVTFGSVFGEKPEAYTWDIVSDNNNRHIELKFLSLPNDLKKKITFSDAKWATRKIAQLTRQQITDAVDLGAWPLCVRKMYVEKIISRRNDLVKAFELESEFGQIPYKYTRDQLKFDRVCDQSRLETEFTQDFELTVGKATRPVIRAVRNALVALSQAALNGSRRIVISPDEFEHNGDLVAEVILDIEREVEANPDAKSEADLFLVRDSLEVGFRIGPKFGAFADVIYTVKYNLAYPIRSRKAGMLNNDFIANVLLPFDIANEKLPESYVLETSHLFDVGAGAVFEDIFSVMSPELMLRHSPEVLLSRSIVSNKRGEDLIFYRDTASYAQSFAQASVRLGLLRIPVIEYLAQTNGFASGRGFVVQRDELDANAELQAALWKAVQEGDPSGIHHREQSFELSNIFSASSKNGNILFWSNSSDERSEDITVQTENSRSESMQYRRTDTQSRNFFAVKEDKRFQVAAYANAATNNGFQIDIAFQMQDSDASTKELSEGYLAFINGLHPEGKKVIPFTPELNYSINQRWGHVLMTSKTTLYPAAVERLLNMSPEAFWSSLASARGLGRAEMTQLRSNYLGFKQANRSRSHVVTRRSLRRSYDLSNKDIRLLEAAERFLDHLNQAAQLDPVTEKNKKVRHLSDALRQTRISDGEFYTPVLFNSVLRYLGLDDIYSSHIITSANNGEVSFVEGQPLTGAFGEEQEDATRFLIYYPISAIDLYTIFDNWL